MAGRFQHVLRVSEVSVILMKKNEVVKAFFPFVGDGHGTKGVVRWFSAPDERQVRLCVVEGRCERLSRSYPLRARIEYALYRGV